MNLNEVLALDKARQKHWIVEQEGYADTYSEAESADPLVDIFENIPTIFSESFIEELAREEVISEDRFLKIQGGLPLTNNEIDVIKKELATRYSEGINHSDARIGYFEFGNKDLIVVFVGWAERREQWDPVFIGLYESVSDAKKAIYSTYSDVYVSEEFLG